MINGFSNVIFDPNQEPIAQVNRADGTLYLKPQIWDTLPAGEKDFILWHERGHLILQTTDEFKCNQYAVKNTLPSHDLTNPELKARITVMQSILTPGRENPSPTGQTSGFTATTTAAPAAGGGLVGAIAGAVDSVFQTLPLLMGGKGRAAETTANAQAQAVIIAAQAKANAAKNQTNLIYGVMAGALVVVIIVLYFVFRKK